MTARPSVLVLGTADWDAVIATNQHHVSTALAERWPVLFTEGAGTRRLRPSPVVADRRPVPARVSVVSPRVVPHHSATTRAVNGWALRWQLRRWYPFRRQWQRLSCYGAPGRRRSISTVG